MSPSGIVPDPKGSTYFDDLALEWSTNDTTTEAAVQKCLNTVARSQILLAEHVTALTRAADRLDRVTDNPRLAAAAAHLKNAVDVVKQAQEILKKVPAGD
ncbi:hypothetical protein [Actinoplanes flavus]|uniref:Uncharacterized protein n=1 Tax=Actinoplanes flavus TaxID=2820290 RepID=A0ABS3UVL0_9ACTN|nr:hypothetical protein [Actinoplanes flavus]MBO3742629.1 hypothetical protein [Actinoplanes flavus]